MALKDFTAGEVLTANDVDEYLVNTRYAVKTADESVTSSTTIQNDDHLSLTVDSNKTYELSAVIIYEAATGGDLQWNFLLPSLATLHAGTVGLESGATTRFDTWTEHVTHGTNYNSGGLGAGVLISLVIRGLIVVSTNSGTARFRWSQGTSNATPTIVKANSYLCIRRVS